MSVVANVAINVDGKQAAAVLDEIKRKVEAMNGSFGKVPGATRDIDGISGAVAALAGRLATAATAITTVQQGIAAAFERGSAEQRLNNLASSTGEFEAAMAAAASASSKFGISQTEATVALADVYGRLKGVGFGLKETTQIYEGFNVAAKQSGISGADAAGVFFQLSQALGKGKLNGDEFISVSERMPQLLDLIAQASGKTRGQLQQMAQEGKITSDILYKALATAAEGSGDLNAKLTDQQRAMGNLGRVADQLLVQIGSVFAPAVVAGAEALTAVGQKLSEWWGYIGSVIFPKVYVALKPLITEFQKIWNAIPWETIIGYLQGAILFAINQLLSLVKLLSPVVAGLIAKLVELAKNPVFQFLAQQMGVLLEKLGISNNEVAKFVAGQEQARSKTQATVDAYSSMPPKIEEAAKKNEDLIKATDDVLTNVRNQKIAIDAQLAGLERVSSISSARLGAEKSLNELRGQQLAREYELAATAQQRYNIAIAIFRQQAQAAALEYRQASDNIALEQIKNKLQLESAQNKYLEIQAEGQLQILKAKNVEEETAKRNQLIAALAAQDAVVESASRQIDASKEIARYQDTAARAQYDSKILAAQTALEQRLVSKEIGLTQSAALQTSNSLGNAYSSSRLLGTATKTVENNASNASYMYIAIAKNATTAANAIAAAANQQARLNLLRGQTSSTVSTTKKAANGAYWPGGFQAFAAGGVVNRPTLGLIGEGGQAEYIIPESKAAGFVSNYLSGARGSAAIPTSSSNIDAGTPTINITTGPVVEFNGERYVTVADMERAMRATANGVIGRLRSPSARVALGMA